MARIIMISLLFIVLVSKCSEDRRYLRKIDGRWQVGSITFKSTGRIDSVWTPDDLVFHFQECSRKENKDINQKCDLQIEEGTERFSYQYRVINSEVFFSLVTPFVSQKFEKILIGPNYKVFTLTDLDLQLRNSNNEDAYIEIRAKRH